MPLFVIPPLRLPPPCDEGTHQVATVGAVLALDFGDLSHRVSRRDDEL